MFKKIVYVASFNNIVVNYLMAIFKLQHLPVLSNVNT